MVQRIRELVCLIVGHSYKTVPGTAGLLKGAEMMICSRCAKLGWRM